MSDSSLAQGRDEDDLAELSAADFIKIVKDASDDQIAEILTGEHRDKILRRAMEAMAGAVRPDRTQGVHAIIHWKFFDAPGGGYDQYEIRVDDGSAEFVDPPSDDPDVTLKGRPVDLAKVLCGTGRPKLMAMRGKLRVAGDVGVAMKLDSWFERPEG